MAFSSYSDSVIVTSEAVSLSGIWIHDPDDPEGTIRNYQWGKNNKADSVDVKMGAIQFIGRKHPVYEFGPYQEESVSASIVTSGVNSDSYQELRAWYEFRDTVVYRDNRARVIKGVVTSFSGQDTDVGNDVDITVNRVGVVEEFL